MKTLKLTISARRSWIRTLLLEKNISEFSLLRLVKLRNHPAPDVQKTSTTVIRQPRLRNLGALRERGEKSSRQGAVPIQKMLNRPLDSDIRGRSTLTVHWIVMMLLPAVSNIGRSLLWIHQAKPTAIFVHLGYGHCSTNSVSNLTSARDPTSFLARISCPSALTSLCSYPQ